MAKYIRIEAGKPVALRYSSKLSKRTAANGVVRLSTALKACGPSGPGHKLPDSKHKIFRAEAPLNVLTSGRASGIRMLWGRMKRTSKSDESEERIRWPSERFVPGSVDQFGVTETSRQFFSRVWAPFLAAEKEKVYSDDLKRVDPALHQAIGQVLHRAGLSFADIGLPTSPTRGKVPEIRSEEEAIERRRALARERARRRRAKLAAVQPAI